MRRAACALLALGALAAGCGDDGDDGGRLVVSAAASLSDAFTKYGEEFEAAKLRLSFAGSDELAAQIRQGVKPDVYAAANVELPAALHREGLVEEPRVFAANRLVLAVPSASSEVRSLEDLERDGASLAVGSESVPVGSYTRGLISRIGAARRERILANVRSEEPDVRGIVGKLMQGAVDAGFVYATDIVAARGALKAIELPDELRPSVAYAAAVVKGARNPDAAREFVDGLLQARGAALLREAGFEPPPSTEPAPGGPQPGEAPSDAAPSR
jgi:molybdate transport system substrate-binding protein